MVNILLVEDNPGDILLVQHALKEYRIVHQLHIIRDGAEALAFLARMGLPSEEPCPDVLLLDLNLPKVEGPRVLTEFRKHPECEHTPVIVVTSSDAQKDRRQMADLGVSRYFKKPSDLDAYLRLGSVVREVIEEAAA